MMESSNEKQWRRLDRWGRWLDRWSAAWSVKPLYRWFKDEGGWSEEERERENMGWRETNQWEWRENVELNIERRKKRLTKKLVFWFGICVRTVSSHIWDDTVVCCKNFRTFRTPYETWTVVSGVPNAKYLAFGTPDENANHLIIFIYFIYFLFFLSIDS